jgi:hypothetical protein
MYAQKIDIPKGVIYHYADDSINSNAKEVINKSIKEGGSSFLFDKSVMIGPNLWANCKGLFHNQGNNIQLNFKIPINNQLIQKTGMAIKEGSDFQKIWALLFNNPNDSYLIRKSNKDEINYYWYLISYEIEEPLFVLERKDHRILINLSKDNHVIFMELL